MKLTVLVWVAGLALSVQSHRVEAAECLATTAEVNSAILRSAVYNGNLKIVKACLKLGVAQDSVAFGEAVEDAILGGKVEMLKAILDWDPTIPSRELPDSTLPLNVAARIYPGFAANEKARYEIVNLLLTYGANPSQAGSGDRTALHCAAMTCNPTLVQKFLDLGADANALDENQATPLKWAAFTCIEETTLPVDESEVDGIVLKITKSLLDKGAKVETHDNLGGFVLHQLARHSRVAASKLVILAGADVNAGDQAGCRPLDYAQASERNSDARVAMIQLLKSKGAKAAGTTCDLGIP